MSFEYNDFTQLHIHTLILDDSKNTKPTLVLVHGFGCSAIHQVLLFKPLMEHFRLVVIDQLGCGGSSRLESFGDEEVDTVDLVDEFMVGCLSAWLYEATQLEIVPELFFLAGHSFGGYLSAMLACKHKDRIEALFLNSAIGPEAVPKEYNFYEYRLSSSQTEPPNSYLAYYLKQEWDKGRTVLDVSRSLPEMVLNHYADQTYREDFAGCEEEMIEA